MSQAAASAAVTGPRPREQRFGLGCALITPFAADGSVDVVRLVGHARRVLADGCVSVTLFGTTGEGASLGLASRAAALGHRRSALARSARARLKRCSRIGHTLVTAFAAAQSAAKPYARTVTA